MKFKPNDNNYSYDSDILNEDKINKLGKDLYNIAFFNKNKYCDMCNSRFCKHCFNTSKNENVMSVDKKLFQNPIIKTVNNSMNIKNNKVQINNENNNFQKNNIDNNLKIQLISNKSDLKLDISNGMHKSQNNNSNNFNFNIAEDGSFNSNNNDIIESIINSDLKNNLEEELKLEKKLTKKNGIQKHNNNDIEIKEENIQFLSKNKNNEKKFKNKENDIFFNLNDSYDEIIEENNKKKKSSNLKDKNLINEEQNDLIEKENKTETNQKEINLIKLNGQPIKKNYINKKFQNISPILSDLLENINKITPNNYLTIKNLIYKIIINNDNNISIEFVNMLYSIAIKQIKFQPIYSKLLKDIEKLCHKKDNKSKSIIRSQLTKICKSNFKKIKIQIEDIKYISSDINFIGELINAQMISKKVGLQCLTHLFNKFQKYNEEKNLINKKEEKYLYLDNIINLLNKFATCIYCYQKEKIRDSELAYFEDEINKNIKLLKDIIKNRQNFDIPQKTKTNLLELIKKSDNDWQPTYLEQNKNI